jgi:hypothetical protein
MPRSSRRSLERLLIILASGVLGGAFAAAPTGIRAADIVWSAVFVAALAYAGAWATPLAMLPAAAAGAVMAESGVGLALAAAAVVAVGATAGQERPSSRLTAVGGGLLGLSLLHRGDASTVSLIGGGTAIVLVVVVAGWMGMSKRRRRRVAWVVGPLAGAVLACTAAGLIAAAQSRTDARDGIDALRAARAAASGGNLDAAVTQFREAERSFHAASAPLDSYGRLSRLVPGLSQQMEAATTAVDTAGDASTAIRQVAATIHLDDIGLTQGTVDLAAVSATERPLAVAVDTLVETTRRLAAVDQRPLLPPIRNALVDALDEARAASASVERAHRSVQELPALLGSERPTRYLVLFTSPVEARNRLGFPGAYAVLQFDAGHLSFDKAGPMGDLVPPGGSFNEKLLTIPARAQPFEAYGVARIWQSVTLPSTGTAVADLATQMGAQVGLGALDGVVLADPSVLAEVVDLLGGATVPGLGFELTRANTVKFLVQDQYLQYPQLGQQQSDRKDALALVAATLGQRLSTITLPKVRTLADRFGPLVDGTHLVVAVPGASRPSAAALLADLGLDGGFPPGGDADVLYLGERNNTGNKIDMFLQRTIDYDVHVARDGSVKADLTVDLGNGSPSTGLPKYIIGSALTPAPPPGTNRTTLLIYSRYQLEDLTVDGVPLTPATLVDGGMLVYQVPLDLAAGQQRRVVAHLTGTAGAAPYAVEAHRTALPRPDEVKVSVQDARSGRSATWSGSPDAPVCVAVTKETDSCDAGRGP